MVVVGGGGGGGGGGGAPAPLTAATVQGTIMSMFPDIDPGHLRGLLAADTAAGYDLQTAQARVVGVLADLDGKYPKV